MVTDERLAEIIGYIESHIYVGPKADDMYWLLTELQSLRAQGGVAGQANKALMDERTNMIETKRQQIEALTSRAEAAEARVKGLEEALEPFADFGEFMEVETEGFSDTDRLYLVPEESDVRIGDLFVSAFRRARTALKGDKP